MDDAAIVVVVVGAIGLALVALDGVGLARRWRRHYERARERRAAGEPRGERRNGHGRPDTVRVAGEFPLLAPGDGMLD